MSKTSGQSSLGVTLRFMMPCELAEVRTTTRAVRTFLEEQGLHPDEWTACELAVTEACNNAVEHVRPTTSHEPIEVRVICNGSIVEFQIADHTSGFDWPDTVSLPDANSERGRGLFIMKSLMDQTSYLRGPDKNILILRKRRTYQSHRVSPTPFASFKETRIKLAECQQAIGNMAKELCFRSETLSAIFRCMAELGRTDNLEDFSYRLLNDLVIITVADWFVLRLVSPTSHQLVPIASSHAGETLTPEAIPSVGPPFPTSEGQAAVTGQDLWFDNLQCLGPDDPIAQLQPNSSGVIHPFFFGDTLIGTLAIGRQNPQSRFSLEQAEVIHTFAEFLAIQVVNTRLQDERVQLRLVSHELQIARDIQRALLPKSFPRLHGFGLDAYYESARQVGGDFYGVVPLSDHSAWLVVADVMGKGVPAAMFAAILRTLVPAVLQWVPRPSDVLAHLNQLLFDELSRVDMFITAQMVLIDLKERQLTVASAGHCPVLLAVENQETQPIITEGMPLGVMPNATFRDGSVNIGPNGRILLYTDGLTEARNPAGEQFGQSRLMSWLERTAQRTATARDLKDELVDELARFQSSQKLQDDQTFIVLAQEEES